MITKYFNIAFTMKIFSFLLKISGVLSISISAIFSLFAMNVYFERAQYGSGLMFADAELLMILVIIFYLLVLPAY